MGIGDELKITVYGNADMSIDTVIDGQGNIDFPLVGRIAVANLTPRQAAAQIEQNLASGNYLHDPHVVVLVSAYRSKVVSVLGYVGKPGEYPLDQDGLRLSNILARAGGNTPEGSRIVTIVSQVDGQEQSRKIDIFDLVNHSNDTNDPLLRGGEKIFVGPASMVYVGGEVQRPGSYPLDRDMTVEQAIYKSGSLTQRGSMSKVKITRRDDTGATQVIKATPQDILQPNDSLYVGKRLF